MQQGEVLLEKVRERARMLGKVSGCDVGVASLVDHNTWAVPSARHAAAAAAQTAFLFRFSPFSRARGAWGVWARACPAVLDNFFLLTLAKSFPIAVLAYVC